VARQLQEICKEIPEIETATALAGYEIMTEGRGSNAGTVLIQLKDWKERRRSVAEIREELEEKAKNLPAIVEFFDPPAVPGFGTSGGFSLRLLDNTGSLDYQAFNKVVREFMDSLRKRPEIMGPFIFNKQGVLPSSLSIGFKLASSIPRIGAIFYSSGRPRWKIVSSIF